jgi:hypothetical protein
MEPVLRRILLTIVLAVATILAKGQGDMEDVVYLKNGSIIHGIIIEQVPGVSIKIQTADRNVFVFRIEEVEKMTKEPLPPRSGRQQAAPAERVGSFENEEIKKSGYYFIAELVPAVGWNDIEYEGSFGMQVVNGYQVNRHFNVGIGFGLNKHIHTAYAPVFLDLRANFLAERVTPFVAFAGGWAFGDPDHDEGGAYVNPAFGVKFHVSKSTALQLSLGYRYQESASGYGGNNYFDYYYDDVQYVNALNFKFGVTFCP